MFVNVCLFTYNAFQEFINLSLLLIIWLMNYAEFSPWYIIDDFNISLNMIYDLM